MASNDSTLLAIASAGPVHTLAELARRLQSLDAALEVGDALGWFNRWYAALTAALIESSRRHRFVDAAFVERLECRAADRYLDALAAHLADPGSGPSCWEPLFQARGGDGALPIQYAIAGINAHVNHDLPIALVAACGDRDRAPPRDAPEHRDYQRLGAILDDVLCDARAWFSDGTSAASAPTAAEPEEGPASSGALSPRAQLDEVLSIWSTKRACEAAWAAAEVRWALRVSPLISHHHLEALDRMVGLANRSLLHPWQPAAHAARSAGARSAGARPPSSASSRYR